MVAIEPRVRTTTVKYGSSVSFNCTAEGNPEPTYQWLQKMPTTQDTVIIRGSQVRHGDDDDTSATPSGLRR